MIEPVSLLVELRKSMPHAVVVTHLGNTSASMFKNADSPRNFYMLGSMGSVIPFALGVSLGTAVPVVAIEGDGGMLMNLGALATAARYAPPNLRILLLDNGSYRSTGGQISASAAHADLAQVGRSCGISVTRRFSSADAEELVSWLAADEFRMAVAPVAESSDTAAPVTLTPTAIASRFQFSPSTVEHR